MYCVLFGMINGTRINEESKHAYAHVSFSHVS